mgnify:CR=1 FL=1
MNTSLHDKTLDLLQNRSVQLTLKQISEDTGITENWLSRYNQDQVKNPSVNLVQTLYEYLTNSKLKFYLLKFVRYENV